VAEEVPDLAAAVKISPKKDNEPKMIRIFSKEQTERMQQK
jgi:hypothetical protein